MEESSFESQFTPSRITEEFTNQSVGTIESGDDFSIIDAIALQSKETETEHNDTKISNISSNLSEKFDGYSESGNSSENPADDEETDHPNINSQNDIEDSIRQEHSPGSKRSFFDNTQSYHSYGPEYNERIQTSSVEFCMEPEYFENPPYPYNASSSTRPEPNHLKNYTDTWSTKQSSSNFTGYDAFSQNAAEDSSPLDELFHDNQDLFEYSHNASNSEQNACFPNTSSGIGGLTSSNDQSDSSFGMSHGYNFEPDYQTRIQPAQDHQYIHDYISNNSSFHGRQTTIPNRFAVHDGNPYETQNNQNFAQLQPMPQYYPNPPRYHTNISCLEESEYTNPSHPTGHVATTEHPASTTHPNQQELFHEMRRQIDNHSASDIHHNPAHATYFNNSANQHNRSFGTYDDQHYSKGFADADQAGHYSYMESDGAVSPAVESEKEDDDDVIIVSSTPSPKNPSIVENTMLNRNQEKFGPSIVYAGIPRLKDYANSIRIELKSHELWQKFHEIGTEMIITKAGRRMFPTLKINISGLHPQRRYIMAVDILPIDNKRYRYAYSSSQWIAAGNVTSGVPKRTYVHPESPACGETWMRQTVVFDKMKLTNNEGNSKGHIILHSMHKYQPRIHLIECEGNGLRECETIVLTQCIDETQENVITFVYPETQFTTVTAYQNQQITKLKIDKNPFAKGFRDTSRNCRTQSRVRQNVCGHPQNDLTQTSRMLTIRVDDNYMPGSSAMHTTMPFHGQPAGFTPSNSDLVHASGATELHGWSL